jgi:hypothetical protein
MPAAAAAPLLLLLLLLLPALTLDLIEASP